MREHTPCISNSRTIGHAPNAMSPRSLVCSIRCLRISPTTSGKWEIAHYLTHTKVANIDALKGALPNTRIIYPDR